MSTPESDQPEPTDEELRAAWEEQLRHVTVADVLIQTAVSLVNLAGRRLGLGPGAEEDRDLAQVRDAIDAVRGLMPVLERNDDAQTLKPLRDAVAQLQLEYAKHVPSAPGSPPPASGPPDPPAGPSPASGRLWVPGR